MKSSRWRGHHRQHARRARSPELRPTQSSLQENSLHSPFDFSPAAASKQGRLIGTYKTCTNTPSYPGYT
jgi:hypothetical protein